ncbi:MAG TPA: MFS transporter [Burkholderiales bacterium]|jgi:MFS family permease|nr:MFS transporter [Burkholderiales bacterium]
MGSKTLRSPLTVLVCGCLIMCISFGIRAGFGLFMQPISVEHAWGREVFSLSIALQNLMWGALGAVAGAFADRFGPGRVIACGAIAYILGLIGLATIDTPWLLHLNSSLFLGGALGGTSFGIILAVIGRTVAPERRSLYMGIATAAGSFGQFLLLPLTQFLISKFGWHNALFALAAIAALIIPLTLALASRPDAGVQSSQSLGEAFHEAMREKGFHLLFWGYFVCGFHIAMLTVHLPSFVTDQGLKAEQGMTALALIGLFNVLGTLSAGILGGRFSKKYLLSTIYIVRAGLISILVFLPLSPVTLYTFACGIGLLWLSTVPLTNGLVGQIFGMRYAAMLASIVFFGHQIGSFIGVWLAGYLYDTTGSYAGAFMISIGLGLFAAIVNLPVNEKPLAERKAIPAAA